MNKSFEKPEPEYLDIFHQAQAKLVEGDIESARELLAQSAELVDDEDFLLYIKGTQAYIEKDVEKLKEVIANIEQVVNKKILERFLARLEAGEEIDYSKDYFN